MEFHPCVEYHPGKRYVPQATPQYSDSLWRIVSTDGIAREEEWLRSEDYIGPNPYCIWAQVEPVSYNRPFDNREYIAKVGVSITRAGGTPRHQQYLATARKLARETATFAAWHLTPALDQAFGVTRQRSERSVEQKRANEVLSELQESGWQPWRIDKRRTRRPEHGYFRLIQPSHRSSVDLETLTAMLPPVFGNEISLHSMNTVILTLK